MISLCKLHRRFGGKSLILTTFSTCETYLRAQTRFVITVCFKTQAFDLHTLIFFEGSRAFLEKRHRLQKIDPPQSNSQITILIW